MIMATRNEPQIITVPHCVASRWRDAMAGVAAASFSRAPDPAPDDRATGRNVGGGAIITMPLGRRLRTASPAGLGCRIGSAERTIFRVRFFSLSAAAGPATIFLNSGFVLRTLIRGTLGLGGLSLCFDTIGLGFKTRTFLTHLLGEPRAVLRLRGRLWRGRWLCVVLASSAVFRSASAAAFREASFRQSFVQPCRPPRGLPQGVWLRRPAVLPARLLSPARPPCAHPRRAWRRQRERPAASPPRAFEQSRHRSHLPVAASTIAG